MHLIINLESSKKAVKIVVERNQGDRVQIRQLEHDGIKEDRDQSHQPGHDGAHSCLEQVVRDEIVPA